MLLIETNSPSMNKYSSKRADSSFPDSYHRHHQSHRKHQHQHGGSGASTYVTSRNVRSRSRSRKSSPDNWNSIRSPPDYVKSASFIKSSTSNFSSRHKDRDNKYYDRSFASDKSKLVHRRSSRSPLHEDLAATASTSRGHKSSHGRSRERSKGRSTERSRDANYENNNHHDSNSSYSKMGRHNYGNWNEEMSDYNNDVYFYENRSVESPWDKSSDWERKRSRRPLVNGSKSGSGYSSQSHQHYRDKQYNSSSSSSKYDSVRSSKEKLKPSSRFNDSPTSRSRHNSRSRDDRRQQPYSGERRKTDIVDDHNHHHSQPQRLHHHHNDGGSKNSKDLNSISPPHRNHKESPKFYSNKHNNQPATENDNSIDHQQQQQPQHHSNLVQLGGGNQTPNIYPPISPLVTPTEQFHIQKQQQQQHHHQHQFQKQHPSSSMNPKLMSSSANDMTLNNEAATFKSGPSYSQQNNNNIIVVKDNANNNNISSSNNLKMYQSPSSSSSTAAAAATTHSSKYYQQQNAKSYRHTSSNNNHSSNNIDVLKANDAERSLHPSSKAIANCQANLSPETCASPDSRSSSLTSSKNEHTAVSSSSSSSSNLTSISSIIASGSTLQKPTLPNLNRFKHYYDESLANLANGWQTETFDKQAKVLNDQINMLSNHSLTRVESELKVKRSLFRLAEIHKNIQQNKISLLEQRIKEIEEWKGKQVANYS